MIHAPTPPAGPAAAAPPNRWRLLVDPEFLRQVDASKQTFALGLYFKPMTFILGNDGPLPARTITIEFPDAKQQAEGPFAFTQIEPGHAVRFTATRRLMGDNAVRVRWFQEDPTQRYWTTLYLPYE